MSEADIRVAAVEGAITRIDTNMERMESSVAQIADAMTKIARLEERHQETRESLARAFDRIEIQEREQSENKVRFERLDGKIAPLQESRGWMLAGISVVMLAVIGAWVKLTMKGP
jgi:chromosome segregation ATPase